MNISPNALRAALRSIYPALVEPRDFTITPAGEISTWLTDARFPRPTDEQLATALSAATALATQTQTIRAALLAEFAAFSAAEQELYRPVVESLRRLLGGHQLAAAREIISLAPAFTDALSAARVRMLALFPAP